MLPFVSSSSLRSITDIMAKNGEEVIRHRVMVACLRVSLRFQGGSLGWNRLHKGFPVCHAVHATFSRLLRLGTRRKGIPHEKGASFTVSRNSQVFCLKMTNSLSESSRRNWKLKSAITLWVIAPVYDLKSVRVVLSLQ